MSLVVTHSSGVGIEGKVQVWFLVVKVKSEVEGEEFGFLCYQWDLDGC